MDHPGPSAALPDYGEDAAKLLREPLLNFLEDIEQLHNATTRLGHHPRLLDVARLGTDGASALSLEEFGRGA